MCTECSMQNVYAPSDIKGRLLANVKFSTSSWMEHSQRLLLVTYYIGPNVQTNGYGCSMNIQYINYDI